MVTKTQAIKAFLNSNTHPDLADLYNHDMEVQINVAQDGGERVTSTYRGRQWHGWSDGLTTWKSFRIPYNAKTIPEYEDTEISYDISEHAEGIGMTGWDWVEKVSRWVAFDFDAIVGHSDRHNKKLNQELLEEIQEAASDIDWVTVRKSTSGKGIHLYVTLDPYPTVNHTEHAALARAILGKMSGITGFDFCTKVDQCGGNMWVWHRKMLNTDGLKLIKEGEPLCEIPVNWRDHLDVVSGRKRKNIPFFVQESKLPESEKMFAELVGQRQRCPLEEPHKILINWLQEKNAGGWYDNDHNMLVTHTYLLKEAHSVLGLKGIFKTLAQGREYGHDHNCFCFPMRSGAWIIRRFTPGVEEDTSWHQDGRGWTRCFYNHEPDLATAARSCNGVELTTGGYSFRDTEKAIEAAHSIGATVKIGTAYHHRPAQLKEHKDGRLVFKIENSSNDDPSQFQGWTIDKGYWTKIFSVRPASPIEPDSIVYDDMLRHLVSENADNCGWMLRSEGAWRVEPLEHVRPALESMGMTPKEVKTTIGSSVFKCWTLVNKPFEPEYPGDRQWNRNAAQFRFTPALEKDDLYYPHWQKILDHIGKGLDQAIKESPWASANGLTKGSDYLLCWLAALVQEPMEPLPYLFFFGEQNCGKTIFHEAFHLLITGGYQRAGAALISNQGYNAELEDAILCVVEEMDLQRNKEAYNRIKDWVTSRMLPIHRKRETPYLVRNKTHWVHCANNPSYCPIFPGDTRITVCHVPPLEITELIPKRVLFERLEEEASDFLAAMLRLELPDSPDRLRIPVIVTQDKQDQAKSNMEPVDRFIEECCHEVTGFMLKFSEFYDKFIEWLEPHERGFWTKKRVGKVFQTISKFPKGRWMKDGGQFYIGNLSLEEIKDNGRPRIILVSDRLEEEPTHEVS